MFTIVTISNKYGTKTFRHYFNANVRTYGFIHEWVTEKFNRVKEIKIDTRDEMVVIVYDN